MPQFTVPPGVNKLARAAADALPGATRPEMRCDRAEPNLGKARFPCEVASVRQRNDHHWELFEA